MAWIAVAPCLVLIVMAIVVIGPPLGDVLLTPDDRLWPPGALHLFGEPEPTKEARFAIALLGPLLLAGVVLAASRRPPSLTPSAIAVLVGAGRALLVAFVATAVLGQNNRLGATTPPLWPIFTVRTLITAALIAIVPLVLLRWTRIGRRAPARLPESVPLAVACLVVAVLVAVPWLVTAITSDKAVGTEMTMNWTLDDPFAVLNGRTPLVDFLPVYAHLLPYPTAAVMEVFGKTTFVFTMLMAVLSGLALLAVYAMLRRVARSSLLGLGLFLPVLGIGFLRVVPGPATPGTSNVTLYAVWPLRYLGAYALAWLTARHVDGAAPRRMWLLFGAAGLVALDNTEFGAAALVATLAALAAAQPPPLRPGLLRLARDAAIGLLAAVATVAVATLARAGELPRFADLLEYPRIFGPLGWTALPMPTLGLHLVLYATYAGAIAVAAVRVARQEADTLLTAMLAWSGTFGLLSASYYVGRSEAGKLIALFSAWGLTLALLTLLVGRALAVREWRRPSVPELMLLLGFGVAACSLAQLPSPRDELRRLGQLAPGQVLPASPFIAEHVVRGRAVAILTPISHRTADELGVTNVSPYAFFEEIATRAQMQRLLDAIRRERAHVVFLPEPFVTTSHRAVLARAGFAQWDHSEAERISLWVDGAPDG